MAELRYSSELASISGNESTLGEFVGEFAEFDGMTTLEQIELLDDLYRPDMGVSDAGAIVLPELIRVAQFFEGSSRLNLMTCIAGIQHGFFADEYGGKYLAKDSDSLSKAALVNTKDEIKSLMVHSHSDNWRSSLEEFLGEFQGVIELLPFNA